jgi:hypothetical protein
MNLRPMPYEMDSDLPCDAMRPHWRPRAMVADRVVPPMCARRVWALYFLDGRVARWHCNGEEKALGPDHPCSPPANTADAANASPN